MQTMAKTANSPRSSSVDDDRPIGNTARKAKHPASVVHLTKIPVRESTGRNRFRTRTATSATAHSQITPVN